MPKEGHSASFWEERLKAFARGLFNFGVGQRPPKNSVYEKKVNTITACPAHRVGLGQKTLFNTSVECTCGCHPKPKPKVAVAASALRAAEERAARRTPAAQAIQVCHASTSAASDVVAASSQQVPATSSQDVPAASSQQVPATDSQDVPAPSTSSVVAEEELPTPILANQQIMQRLPPKWREGMSKADQLWIAKELYSDGKIHSNPKLWYHPPQVTFSGKSPPEVENYFKHRLLVWMPRKQFSVVLRCPECQSPMTSKGVYRTLRRVWDIDEFYYMATEYLECRRHTSKTVTAAAWSRTLLEQLDEGHRRLFPVLLTVHHACDIRVITLLRNRTLGNSPTQLHKSLTELYTERWLRTTAHYLSDCESYNNSLSGRFLNITDQYRSPSTVDLLPGYRWLLSVYAFDIFDRLDEVKANITSVCGKILKVDSTKKIIRKLAGRDTGTASWCTNVGNEIGQVLISVFTVSEGRGLENMTRGIVKRYEVANQPQPDAIYAPMDLLRSQNCSTHGHHRSDLTCSIS